MNEPAMAPQEYPPTMVERIDNILKALGLDYKDVKLLKGHIELLRLQARNGSNRKKALADLHRAHQALVMENRWLREAIRGVSMDGNPAGAAMWDKFESQAKKTLWSSFRRLRSDKDAGFQLARLTQFIMLEIPGEPSRSEGAVDTIIRWAKNIKNIHGDDPLVAVHPEDRAFEPDKRKASLVPDVGDNFFGLHIDIGGASASEIINGDAPIDLTGPDGKGIFHGTWAELKAQLKP